MDTNLCRCCNRVTNNLEFCSEECYENYLNEEHIIRMTEYVPSDDPAECEYEHIEHEADIPW